MKFLFFLFSLVLSIPCVSAPTETNKEELAFKQLEEESRRVQNLDQEKEFSDHLRQFIAILRQNQNNSAQDLMARTHLLAQTYREKIAAEYPKFTKDQVRETGGSVGVALFKENLPQNELIPILLREARLLSASAQVMLHIIYTYPTDKVPAYDPRILAFYKEEAEQYRSRRGLYVYGKIILNGIGVAQNKAKGIKFLEQSDLPEAHIVLADHCLEEKNIDKMRFHLEQAAAMDDPQGLYNLGVMELDTKNYAKAYELFEKALEIEPTYWNAQLELARLYFEGWGTPKNIEKAVTLFESVIKNTDDEETKRVVLLNLDVAKKLLKKEE